MMTFLEHEKEGFKELLLNEENKLVLVLLAKSLVKNSNIVSNEEVALNIVHTLGKDALTLLSKKLITKEILFKYLTKKHIPIEQNATKLVLVGKTLDHWQNSSQNAENGCDTHTLDTVTVPSNKIPSPNVVASAFGEWFFGKYNADELQAIDFWPDANLRIRINADDATEESACHEANNVLGLLQQKKSQFGFYFNLNASNTGIQGRMDVHGMLLVLTCGTLHTQETCVGVFEWVFGLLRDPYECNNWKIKTMRCVLRSEGDSNMPTLDESESLRGALSISPDWEDSP